MKLDVVINLNVLNCFKNKEDKGSALPKHPASEKFSSKITNILKIDLLLIKIIFFFVLDIRKNTNKTKKIWIINVLLTKY